MSQTNQTQRVVPDVAPKWDELRERSPYNSDVRDDPSGGVVVHRCHPDGEAKDYFAFAQYHKTMKGYKDKNTYLFDGPVEDGEKPAVRAGRGRWNSAVGAFHVREGSHEDCAVCQGDADPAALLEEVVDRATAQVGGEHNVARSTISTGRDYGAENQAFVYLDSHGMATSGPYEVNNSTRHWEGAIEQHPYVQMIKAEEVGEGGNWSSPDNTLKITLACYYPARGPEVTL
jgi:hypothetical protein